MAYWLADICVKIDCLWLLMLVMAALMLTGGKLGAIYGVRLMFGVSLRDTNCAVKVARADLLRGLTITDLTTVRSGASPVARVVIT